MTFVLDTGILGRLCHPHVAQHRELTEWLVETLSRTPRVTRVVLPEIADYELRRKLLHLIKKNSRAQQSLARLDELTRILEYRPLTTATMRRAAMLWADARHRGLPTAPPEALDSDVILAAQTIEVGGTIITMNRKHLARFVPAVGWEEVAGGRL
ncbi:MAG: PIN domain-containing protein [Candidatus Binatia bacterium]|jgi:predicted nucleic acid-binding protein